jgi:hypothetical protein
VPHAAHTVFNVHIAGTDLADSACPVKTRLFPVRAMKLAATFGSGYVRSSARSTHAFHVACSSVQPFTMRAGCVDIRGATVRDAGSVCRRR